MGAADAWSVFASAMAWHATGSDGALCRALAEQGVPFGMFDALARGRLPGPGSWTVILAHPWATISGATAEDWGSVPTGRVVAVIGRDLDGAWFWCQGKDPFYWDGDRPRDATWGRGSTDGVPEACAGDPTLIKDGVWVEDAVMKWLRILAAVLAIRHDS